MRGTPLVFRNGPTRINPIGFCAPVVPWSPATALEGQAPSLWLRADQGVYTGGARQFYSADKGSLRIADNAAISTGDIDFTVAGWVYFDALGDQYFFSKDSGVTREYGLRNVSGNTIGFYIWDASSTELSASWGTTTATGQWYFIVAWHDSVANTMNLQIDNGAVVSTATSGLVPNNSTSVLSLGNYSSGSSLGLNGRLSEWSVWKRTLTTAEKTWLYNSGSGRVYGELGVAATDGSALLTSLSAYWNLNETSGTANAIDQHSTNDLIPTFAELISNGGFETAGGGGADVFGSWVEGSGGTGTVSDEGTITDAGSHALHLTGDGGATNLAYVTQLVFTEGHDYTVTFRARYNTAGGVKVAIGSGNASIKTLTGSYATYSHSGTCSGGDGNLWFSTYQATTPDCFIDTVSAYATAIPAADGPASVVVSDTGSVGTNHGTLTNFASPETSFSTDVPSAIGSGFSLIFDGVDDWVKIPDFAYSRTALSVCCWVKTTTASGGIFTHYDTGASQRSWYLSTSSGKLQVVLTADGGALTSKTYASTDSINDGAWHHIGFTWNSGTLILYLDGAATAFTVVGGDDDAFATLHDSTGSIALGSYTNNGAWQAGISGKIDDPRIFSGTVLSLSQFAELAAGNEATGATPTNKWTFDDGPPTALVDGDPVCSFESLEGNRYQFLQAIADQRFLYRASAIGGQPGLESDGTNDIMTCINGAVLTGGAFTTIAIWKQKSVPNLYQTLIATSDTAGATKYFALHARGNTANPHIGYEQRNADTADLLDGSTDVTDELDCAGYWSSSGTTISARLNGTAQTLAVDGGANNGDGPGNAETADKDVTTIGGLKHTSETNFAGVILCELIHYPVELTAASRAIVAAYILSRYGLTL